MKRKLLFIVFSILVLIDSISAQTLVNGIYYSFNSSAKTAAITKNSSKYSSFPSDGKLPTTVTYNGVTYKITSIESSAFGAESNKNDADLPQMDVLVIPEGYENIGSYAFARTFNSITLPTTIKSVSYRAFRTKKLIVLANTEISGLRASVRDTSRLQVYVSKSYSSYTKEFNNLNVYSNLSSVFTVNGVKYVLISPSERTCEAFDCSYDKTETEITIDETVKYKNIDFKVIAIKPRIFYNNRFVKYLKVNAKSVFPLEACYGCSELEDLTIGTNTIEVSRAAFSGCKKLSYLTIEHSNDVIKLSDHDLSGTKYGTFYDCPLKKIVLDRPITYTYSSGSYSTLPFGKTGSNSPLSELIIGEIGSTINAYLFSNHPALQSVKIPSNIKKIRQSAFQRTGLTSIVIPATVDSIENSAFAYCQDLASVDIVQNNKELKIHENAFGMNSTPSGVVDLNLGRIIRKPVFSKMATLKTAKLTSNVTYIPANAFYKCSNLESTNVPAEVNSILDSTYNGCAALKTFDLEEGSQLALIGNGAFKGCAALDSIVLPETVKEIGEFAFFGCKSMKKANIPWGNTVVKQSCFNGCSSLRSIVIPNSVKTIEKLAFASSGLKVVNIPASVKELNGNPFSKCKSLDSLNIYKSSDILSINGEFGSTSLKYVNIGRELAWTAYSTEKSLFTGCTSLRTAVFGPYNTKVFDYMFSGCTYLDSVLITPSVGYIGEYAFYTCSNLKHVNLPVAVKSIKQGTFAYSGLNDLIVHNTVKDIGTGVFKGCKSFKNIDIEDGSEVLRIEYSEKSKGAFVDCPLNTAYIGRNLSYDSTSVGGYSPFYHNISLEKVALGDQVEYVSKWQFSGCSGIKSFHFGDNLNRIGAEAFSDCVSMTELYAENPEPPICGEQALDDINKFECTLYVPNSSLSDYQSADQWKEFFFVEGYEVEKVLDESVELSSSSLSVYLGEVGSLQATVLPKNATDKTVTWVSSNDKVVKVNEYGDVTAISGGTAVITATTANGNKATCKVTVLVNDTKIAFTKETMTMNVDQKSTLSVIFTPSSTTDKSLVWKSSNEKVATVDNGKVEAIAEGKTTITATSANGNIATCVVTVKKAPVIETSIVLDLESASLKIDEELQLSVSFNPSDVTDQTITWSSSDYAIATVSGTGVVTAISYGTATITATSAAGYTATCEVDVKNPANLGNNISNRFSVLSLNGDIVINNAEIGSEVSIFTVDGTLITSSIVSSNKEIINLGSFCTVVIVKIDNFYQKVLVK